MGLLVHHHSKEHLMQTFLPYPGYAESVRTLDRQRLGKQRVETFQILQQLTGLRLVTKDADGKPLDRRAWTVEPVGKGWGNHPMTRMWRGHEGSLLAYQRVTVDEWTRRGYKDTCWEKSLDLLSQSSLAVHGDAIWADPEWLGREDFHLSHRSNLVRKDREFYGPQFPDTPDDLPYVWPV